MIAAVKHELSESHVYAILNGTRSLLEDHQPIIETLKALSEDNIKFWAGKEVKYGIELKAA